MKTIDLYNSQTNSYYIAIRFGYVKLDEPFIAENLIILDARFKNNIPKFFRCKFLRFILYLIPVSGKIK